eukprot:COSAG05_NODE_271_length_12468_cov_8.607810_17_plen_131_part_00
MRASLSLSLSLCVCVCVCVFRVAQIDTRVFGLDPALTARSFGGAVESSDDRGAAADAPPGPLRDTVALERFATHVAAAQHIDEASRAAATTATTATSIEGAGSGGGKERAAASGAGVTEEATPFRNQGAP